MPNRSTRSSDASDASPRFLRSAPLGAIAAGVLLLATGSQSLTSIWSPRTLALTHLGTLGFLTVAMMGALYRWIPALTARATPRARTAYAVHALLWVGLTVLVGGLLAGASRAAFVALTVLAVALLGFLPPLGRSLWRSRERSDVVAALALALASLFVVGLLGLWMAHGHSGMRFPGPRGLWIQVHMSVGFLGWTGSLVSVLAWELLPLRFGAPSLGRRSRRLTLTLIAAGVVLPVLVLLLDLAGQLPSAAAPERLALLGAAPAAAAVWLLQPLLALRSLARASPGAGVTALRLWQAGLWAAPLAAAAAVAAHFLAHPRWGLLLGWLAIWGWAGAILHAWLHGLARSPGAPPSEPSARAEARAGPILHVASVVTGVAAIASGEDWLARATGVLLIAVGLQLARSLARAPLRSAPGVIPPL